MSAEPNQAPYLLGAAKRDITCLIPGHGLLGWSDPGHVAQWVEAPLHARAFVVQDRATGNKVALVNCEITFITVSITQEVVRRLQALHPELGYNFHNVHLSAQHTHSAPGGQSYHLIYSLTCPGFTPQVFETYVQGIVEAIVEADSRKQPGHLRRTHGAFAEDIPVAFNRAMEPYNLNPEVTEKLPKDQAHLAVDREMQLLRLDAEDGTPLGTLNWFAVHTTTVHKDKSCISPDNKGYAARKLESWLRNQPGAPEVVCAFAQSTTGDVTPNYKLHPGDFMTRGTVRDDFQNLVENGTYQFEHARGLWENAAHSEAMPARVDSFQVWVDMSDLAVDPAFTGGMLNQRTGEGCMGAAFMGGTLEGPGMGPGAISLISTIGKALGWTQPDVHGEKVLAVRGKAQTFLGFHPKDIPLPDFITGYTANLRRWGVEDAIGPQPILPQVVPVQVVIIGDLALASVPAEPTTIAGRRLADTVQQILAPLGVRHTICSGYTGAYSGYITTREEYAYQRYEGGHTLFGKWTCAAYQTILDHIARQLLLPPNQRTAPYTAQPPVFTEEDLAKRSFQGPDTRFYLDDLKMIYH